VTLATYTALSYAHFTERVKHVVTISDQNFFTVNR